jgi:hypothetical protein
MSERFVCTVDGIAVLAAGGSVEEALAADDAAEARWAAEREAEAELLRLKVQKRKHDLAEQRLRIDARLRRRQRLSGGSGAEGST